MTSLLTLAASVVAALLPRRVVGEAFARVIAEVSAHRGHSASFILARPASEVFAVWETIK